MEIRIIDRPVTRQEVTDMAREQFGDMIKAVIDVSGNIMALGGELHADEEAVLLDRGGRQQDLWGINLYPQRPGDDWIEFDSMINIRPGQGNRSRSVVDPEVQKKIINIVCNLVKD